MFGCGREIEMSHKDRTRQPRITHSRIFKAPIRHLKDHLCLTVKSVLMSIKMKMYKKGWLESVQYPMHIIDSAAWLLVMFPGGEEMDFFLPMKNSLQFRVIQGIPYPIYFSII